MKQYKQNVIARMVELANQIGAFSIRRAALDCGINHLKADECQTILCAFLKARPDFKPYRTYNECLFTSLFVTNCECPLPDADCDREYVVQEPYGSKREYLEAVERDSENPLND